MEALIDLRTATVAQFDAAEQTCLDLDQNAALAAASGPGAPPVARMPLGVDVSRFKPTCAKRENRFQVTYAG